MIEEEAVVAAVEAGHVWIEKARRPACGSCASPCTSAVMGEFMGESLVQMEAKSLVEVAPGDRVVVGLDEGALVKGSFAVYLWPIIGLFAGAIMGKGIGAVFLSVSPDVAAIAGGLLGLIGSIAILKSAAGFSQEKLQPVVLRKVN
jgi:sigma-E factor negative regulatory protein RseC